MAVPDRQAKRKRSPKRRRSKAAAKEKRTRRNTAPTSTVGRSKSITLPGKPAISSWSDEWVSVSLGDSLDHYAEWKTPIAIVSDGGYGILGFEGDTSDHMSLPEWYEPHVIEWAKTATPQTTLWFWNSEIGWAAVHPILERHGWRYQNCNMWDKGLGHIAGNVNTAKIRRFPVVSEVCVQYVFEARVDDFRLKEWLLCEWKRTGLPLREANTACGVADAATRKYLDQGHLWYFPPPETFERMQRYANEHGDPAGRPYFCIKGKRPATAAHWSKMRSKFHCPHGYTNMWSRPQLSGAERVKVNGNSGRAVHLNQKPLNLMRLIIEATTDEGDVVWEPFGGLFSAILAARSLKRKGYSCEMDPTYFHFGVERLRSDSQELLFT